jgi:TatD DNase family protein
MDTTQFPKVIAMLVDIHTHQTLRQEGCIQVMSMEARAGSDFVQSLENVFPGGLLSVGVHPWKSNDWSPEHIVLLKEAFRHPRVVFIGEIGLDRNAEAPLEQQINVFETQLELASSLLKPVVIHSVGNEAALLALKKKYPKIPGWILHGFRGKPQESSNYLQHGFHLSFGPRNNLETLRACPLERMFLETDDREMSITDWYAEASRMLGCSVDELESRIFQNFQLFLHLSL